MIRKYSSFCASVCLLLSLAALASAQPRGQTDVYTRIMQLEDERKLGDGELEALLQHPVAAVRARAALALGRIGDKRATPALLKALAAALERTQNRVEPRRPGRDRSGECSSLRGATVVDDLLMHLLRPPGSRQR